MSIRMRAKMKLQTVTRHEHGCDVLKFSAVGRKEAYPSDGSDENNSYAKFTPSATLEMTITNPALHGKFNPGEVYYLDFTPAE